MAWVSPDGHNDPDNAWANEIRAYDENTATFTNATQPDKYLELTLVAAINCDKVRFWVWQSGMELDVWYTGAWHNIFADSPANGAWVEQAIGSTESVDKAQIKMSGGGAKYIYEFDFNQVAVAPTRRIFITHV